MANDQLLYKDSQNFIPNIEEIYKFYISRIDEYRSYVNIYKSDNQDIINDVASINKNRSSIQVELTPQESRCHAFYRLIGLPVINKDKTKFYNPGYCPPDIKRPTGEPIILNKNNKLKIAENPIINFNKLSEFRETYFSRYFANTFQKSTNIDAAVLAVSSYNIRKFSAPLEKTTETFDTNINNQSYNIPIFNSKRIALTEYVDSSGNKPTEIQKKSKRYHIIKPFIVDARIEYSVIPINKIICVPFLEKSQSIRDNVELKKPFLEQVCRDRLNIYNEQNVSGDYIQRLNEIIKSVPSIKDEQLIKSINNKTIYGESEQVQFLKYLNIIRFMMKELFDAQKTIQAIENDYYWTPIPSKEGPEKGSSFPKINLSSEATNLRTSKDNAIVDFTVINETSKLSSDIKEVNLETDIGQFVFADPSEKSAIKKTDSTSGFGSIVEKNLKELEIKRNSGLQFGSKALKNIEIIMGEFSGLGLCDIIAIIGSLYIIEKKYLVGLLDDDAFERMKFEYNFTERADITSSLNALEANVKNYYNLMDKVYEDVRKNNTK